MRCRASKTSHIAGFHLLARVYSRSIDIQMMLLFRGEALVGAYVPSYVHVRSLIASFIMNNKKMKSNKAIFGECSFVRLFPPHLIQCVAAHSFPIPWKNTRFHPVYFMENTPRVGVSTNHFGLPTKKAILMIKYLNKIGHTRVVSVSIE